MLGTIFAFTAGKRVYVYFATYCIVFSIIWIAAAYVGWAIGGSYNEAAIRKYGGREEEEDDDAKSRGRRSSSSIGRQQLPGPLMAWMNNNLYTQRHHDDNNICSTTNTSYYDEEDDIDNELLAILKGQGSYTRYEQ